MGNPMVVANNIPQNEILLGDILKILKLLVNDSKSYSKDIGSNIRKEIFLYMYCLFKRHCKGIPSFSMHELHKLIEEMLGRSINLNPHLKELLPIKDNVSGTISLEFLKNFDSNIWKHIFLGFYVKNFELPEDRIFTIEIKKQDIFKWYGSIERRTVEKDFDKLLKVYKIGQCTGSIEKEENILLIVDFKTL